MSATTLEPRTGAPPAVDSDSGRVDGIRDAIRTALTPDLALLVLFLATMMIFGRSFAKAGLGGELYVTEVVLLAVAVLALLRVGVTGAVARVRGALPALPLLLLWTAGAIALVRGLAEFGLSQITHDVGLVEYSVMLALVPVVADTRPRLRLLLTALLGASVIAMLLYALYWMFPPESAPGPWPNPDPAAAIYFAVFIAWVGARYATGRAIRPLEIAVALLGVVLLQLMSSRGVWLAIITASVCLVALAVRGRRLRTFAITLAVFALTTAAAFGIEKAREGWTGVTPDITTADADPNYITDDGMSGFVGGTEVTDDAARGSLSRELLPAESLELSSLGSLEPGKTYSALFWIKPLTTKRTFGVIGDPSGQGWSATWDVQPQERWQAIKQKLVATSDAERVVMIADERSGNVRIDGLRVMKGNVSFAAAKAELPATDVRRTEFDSEGPGILAETEGTFEAGEGGGANANARWRVAIAGFMLEETLSRPLLGAGFGAPTNFEFEGAVYDRRTGDPADPYDVTGPHNSFVNLIFRTGLLGLIPLVWLLVVAGGRVRDALRDFEPPARAVVVATVTALAFAAAIAFFNVALESPQMSLMFWGILAVVFLVSRRREQSPHPPAPTR